MSQVPKVDDKPDARHAPRTRWSDWLPWPEIVNLVAAGGALYWVGVGIVEASAWMAVLAVVLLVGPRIPLHRVWRAVKWARASGLSAWAVRFRGRTAAEYACAVTHPDRIVFTLSRSASFDVAWSDISEVDVSTDFVGRPQAVRLVATSDGSSIEMSLLRPFGLSTLRGAAVRQCASIIASAWSHATGKKE